MSTHDTCAHGKSLREPCLVCEKIWGIDERQRTREDKMREALTNARSWVSLYHDDVGRACLAQIDDALALSASEKR